jgi:hypothetical protein
MPGELFVKIRKIIIAAMPGRVPTPVFAAPEHVFRLPQAYPRQVLLDGHTG